jgi:hypothetical protein
MRLGLGAKVPKYWGVLLLVLHLPLMLRLSLTEILAGLFTIESSNASVLDKSAKGTKDAAKCSATPRV